MAGLILELAKDIPQDGRLHGNEALGNKALGNEDLSNEVDYAAQYIEEELCEHCGLPVEVETDEPSRSLVVHSPQWKKRYGTFRFQFKIVDEEHVYIDQLFVPEPLQHQGIGLACGKTLIQLCEKLRKQRIYLWSKRSAERFWEKLSFSLAETETWNNIMSEVHGK
jgi:GNAT superfamily N-acetyltransferase